MDETDIITHTANNNFLNELIIDNIEVIYSHKIKEPQIEKDQNIQKRKFRNNLIKQKIPEINPLKKEKEKKNELMKRSKITSQIQADHDLTSRIEERLNIYDEVKNIKKEYKGTEFEENYIIPFNNKLKEQIHEENYTNFLKNKNNAIKQADLNPIPIRSSHNLHPIPYIKVSTKGLKDPNNKYKNKMEKERSLTEIVNNVHGLPNNKKQIPPNSSLNFQKLQLNQQTRFFYGSDIKLIKFGKKQFDGAFKSNILEQINMF